MAQTIRRAEMRDLDELLPLFDAYREFFTGRPMPDSREFLTERLGEQDSVILLAEAESGAAGFLQLYPLFSSWYATRIWFLSDLYVAEAFRNQRIGRQLVEAAQSFARNSGSRSIMVEIPHREPHLISFYESLDFNRDKDFNLYRCYLVESTESSHTNGT